MYDIIKAFSPQKITFERGPFTDIPSTEELLTTILFRKKERIIILVIKKTY